jgi:hypothetical protein
MRVLRRVVAKGPGRRARAGLALAAATASLTGCAQFDAALGQQQAVVTFREGATLTQRLAVRTACARPPVVTAPPLPSDLSSQNALHQLTYRLRHASDADVARLETCLAKFPAVAGISLQDSTDTGG